MVPIPSYSHQIPHRKLVLELHKRGHEIVYVTSDPVPVNSTRLTQIDISDTYDTIQFHNFMKLRFEGMYGLKFMQEFMPGVSDSLSEQLLNNTEVRRLYAPDSGVKFDVILNEFLFMPATYAMAYRFDTPYIDSNTRNSCVVTVNHNQLEPQLIA
ncbi:uncharacterized protein LOC143264518 [Megachile rotundata]|uniref:uncharacterized protein LOC143264518 n=1 Tax=Megachile rotundata TaxID=143995 RepID=UPI003FD25FA2